jgi:hypothetical protein
LWLAPASFLREAIGCHSLRAVAAANEMKD